MKFLHLSDLHLGLRLKEYSLIEDQKNILDEIIKITDAEQPDAVIIAGDIYDKPYPPAEAVKLFDDFLVKLAQRKKEVFIIAGNHDSAERLAFANRILDVSGVHISSVYNGQTQKFTIADEHGSVNFYLLPFIKPANVRAFYPDEKIESYTDAMKIAIKQMELNTQERNILVTHQFITGAEKSSSEEINVGGADNIDVSVFKDFDYVALGHLHKAQNVGSEKIRYCGTPLKYSFAEASHIKSVTVAEISAKNELRIRSIPLSFLRDMSEVRGTFEEITAKEYYQDTSLREDYVCIVLTDENEIPNAVPILRGIYKNMMMLRYENERTRNIMNLTQSVDTERKSPIELFREFYEKINGTEMSEQQTEYIRAIFESLQEGE